MPPERLERPGHPALAFERIAGKGPATVFLGGYASNMEGEKASHLAAKARERDQAFLRFDYRGHGRSESRFEDFTLSEGIADVLDILDCLTEGPVILAGSSMGGWIALRAARERPQKIAGILGIAAAPDFTEDFFSLLNAEQKDRLTREGWIPLPAAPNETPGIMTQKFLTDAQKHLILPLATGGKYEISCPARFLHGKQDDIAPWEKIETLRTRLSAPALSVRYIEDGEHRLSRPRDLALIDETLEEMREDYRKTTCDYI